MLFHSHIFNPISTGVSKPSLVSQLGSPSRRTGTVKCATIILRDEFESLCKRGLPLFFLSTALARVTASTISSATSSAGLPSPEAAAMCVYNLNSASFRSSWRWICPVS